MNRHVRLYPFLALWASMQVSTSLLAQTNAPQPADKRLFTHNDAVAVGLVTAATLAITAFDKRIAQSVSAPEGRFQRSRFLTDRAKNFNHVNEQTLTVGGLALYAVGRLSRSPTLADMSFHVAEAVVVASVVSQVIRLPLGRERPIVPSNGGSDPFVFRPFKGYNDRDYRAFPSIHSASGFAAAAVLSGEVSQRWPSAHGYVAPVLYVLAATPGLARMHMNQHWASDVVMGAFVGILAGQKVVRYNHSINPRNKVNRFFLGRDAGVDVRNEQVIFRITRTF